MTPYFGPSSDGYADFLYRWTQYCRMSAVIDRYAKKNDVVRSTANTSALKILSAEPVSETLWFEERINSGNIQRVSSSSTESKHLYFHTFFSYSYFKWRISWDLESTSNFQVFTSDFPF